MLPFLGSIETKWNPLPERWVKSSYGFFDDMIFGTRDVVITLCTCRLVSIPHPVESPSVESVFAVDILGSTEQLREALFPVVSPPGRQ